MTAIVLVRIVAWLLSFAAACGGHPRPPAAAQNPADALCKSGPTCFDYGAAIEVRAQDDTRMAADRFYRRACTLGELRGCNALAILLVEDYTRLAAVLFAEACDAHYVAACTNSALLAESGRFESTDSPDDLLRRFESACDQGSSGACRRLAEAFARGDGKPHDPARADGLLDLACAGNDVVACAELGRLLAGGVPHADLPRSIAYSTRACMASDDAACEWLATSYELGPAAVRDPMRAASLYARTCANGSDVGCLGLNRLFRRGHASHLDVAGAQRKIGDACSQSGGAACEAVADFIIADENAALDVAEVGRLLNEACDGSDAAACGRLGEMLLSGAGLPKDETRARALLGRACRGGYEALCDDCDDSQTCTLDGSVAGTNRLRESLRRIADAWIPDCKAAEGTVCPPYGWHEARSAKKPAWERDIDFYHRGCEAGLDASCARLDARFAMTIAEERCGDGDLLDCLFAAEAHGHDTSGPGGAILFFEKACELQHGLSCARVGWWYADVASGGPNLVRGIELLRTACGLEVDVACTKLDTLGVTP